MNLSLMDRVEQNWRCLSCNAGLRFRVQGRFIICSLLRSGETATPERDEIDLGCLSREDRQAMDIVAVLLILWLLGFSLHIGGGLIHLLLVVGLVVLIINLLCGRRTAI